MRRTIIIISILIVIVSCKTTAPIVIRPVPNTEITDDMTIEQFLAESTDYRNEIQKWVDDIINQIISKAAHIDMRDRETK